MANAGGAAITLQRLWEPPTDVSVAADHGGHGGGDDRMLTALYGPADPSGETSSASASEPASGDEARQGANERDGALALLSVSRPTNASLPGSRSGLPT
jgi:hypothetical protein